MRKLYVIFLSDNNPNFLPFTFLLYNEMLKEKYTENNFCIIPISSIGKSSCLRSRRLEV